MAVMSNMQKLFCSCILFRPELKHLLRSVFLSVICQQGYTSTLVNTRHTADPHIIELAIGLISYRTDGGPT